MPLIIAASVRDDTVEKDRLARSAPRVVFRLPDYWGLAEGLQNVAVIHLLGQLDLTALGWRLEGALE